MKKKIKKLKHGFTLVEMIVAVALFAVVMTMVLGTLLNISNLQRKVSALRAVNDNINFSLEMMSREIRTGKDYCSVPCTASSFNFTNALGDSVVYVLDNGVIKKSVNGGEFLAITSSEVEIKELIFVVTGEESGDGLQPRVTIILRGTAGEKEGIKTNLNIQTTVSQRVLDS